MNGDATNRDTNFVELDRILSQAISDFEKLLLFSVPFLGIAK